MRPTDTPDRPLRLAAFGECMVELTGTAFGAMHQSYGGDTLNAAVYLARSLARPDRFRIDFATGLGDDPMSRGLVARWAEDGVGRDLCRTVPGRGPGLYMISVRPDGERDFHYWRRDSAARAYFDAPSTPLEEAAGSLALLHLSGISLAILSEADRARLFAVVGRVRAAGGRVSFDSNYRPALWSADGGADDAYARAYAGCDIALVGLEDEQLRGGLPDAPTTLARVLALPAAEVVVKRGAASVIVRTADGVVEVPPGPPVPVVDTTAAGDAFAGAYLAARLEGAAPADAVRAGQDLAAHVVGHPGAIAPRRS